MHPACTERIRGGEAPGPEKVCEELASRGRERLNTGVGTVQHIGEQKLQVGAAPPWLSASL